MNSSDTLTKWWCLAKSWKSVTYPLWQDVWLWNLENWWFMIRLTHPSSHMFFWPPGYIRSRDKLKTEYFFPQKTYGRVLTNGEAKPIMKLQESDHVITRGHVSNWKLNISFSTRSIPPHLAGWWGMTLWPCNHLRSKKKKFKTKI